MTEYFVPAGMGESEYVEKRSRFLGHVRPVESEDEAKAFIAENGFDPTYGARPLKRYIQRHVETALGRFLLGGKAKEGSTVTVDAGKDGLTIK